MNWEELNRQPKSGVAHFIVEDEQQCFSVLRKILSFIPFNNLENPPRITPKDNPRRQPQELNSILPSNPNMSYDMGVIIRKIIDNEDFLEVQRLGVQYNSGICKTGWNSRGIVANNPAVLAGVLDIDSCESCSSFH